MKQLKMFKPANIKNLIKNSNISHIFINGSKAKELYIKYNQDLLDKTTFLPSTSARNAKYSLNDLFNYYQIIKQYLK